jgi:hypothetical protein
VSPRPSSCTPTPFPRTTGCGGRGGNGGSSRNGTPLPSLRRTIFSNTSIALISSVGFALGEGTGLHGGESPPNSTRMTLSKLSTALRSSFGLASGEGGGGGRSESPRPSLMAKISDASSGLCLENGGNRRGCRESPVGLFGGGLDYTGHFSKEVTNNKRGIDSQAMVGRPWRAGW